MPKEKLKAIRIITPNFIVIDDGENYYLLRFPHIFNVRLN